MRSRLILLVVFAVLLWLYLVANMVLDYQHNKDCSLTYNLVGGETKFTLTQDIVQQYRSGGKCITLCSVNNSTMSFITP